MKAIEPTISEAIEQVVLVFTDCHKKRQFVHLTEAEVMMLALTIVLSDFAKLRNTQFRYHWNMENIFEILKMILDGFVGALAARFRQRALDTTSFALFFIVFAALIALTDSVALGMNALNYVPWTSRLVEQLPLELLENIATHILVMDWPVDNLRLTSKDG